MCESFDTFQDFVESRVIPHRDNNPNDIRLDGNTSGGNREVFGYFNHQDRKWKVNSDTHYEPLMLAYRQITQRQPEDPFRIEGNSLILIDQLQNQLPRPEFKYLYIYQA